MSDRTSIHKVIVMQFAGYEWTLTVYYAARFRRKRGEIVRAMIVHYVDADPDFDAVAFQRWAKKGIKALMKDLSLSPEFEDKMQRQVARLIHETHPFEACAIFFS